MLKKVLLVLIGVIAAVVVYAGTRPDEFVIQRAATMRAPATVIFARLNALTEWPAWSPWAKLDPDMKREYSGAAAGPGAVYYWSGNDAVGEGRMTIEDAKDPESVTLALEFIRPLPSLAQTEIRLVPKGDETEVTWLMRGRSNLPAKVIGLFISIDKMVGKDFEKGLGSLKELTEAAAKAPAGPKVPAGAGPTPAVQP